MRIKPPLKIHGGKHYTAKWIISHFSKHLHYVEPYFGGGSVLLQKPTEWYLDHSEVVNDIDEKLMCFWGTLQDPELFDLFRRRIEGVPVHESRWQISEFLQGSNKEFVNHAVNFFIRARQSMAGRRDCFTPITRNRLRRGMNEQASAWLSAIEGLPAVHERLKRVVILNRDAIDCIKTQDGKNTFYYCDPPYYHPTRSEGSTDIYDHEMSREQHIALLQTLAGIEGKFLLSGYRSKLYDKWAEREGWRRHEKEIDNKSSHSKSKEKRIECLWANF